MTTVLYLFDEQRNLIETREHQADSPMGAYLVVPRPQPEGRIVREGYEYEYVLPGEPRRVICRRVDVRE